MAQFSANHRLSLNYSYMMQAESLTFAAY